MELEELAVLSAALLRLATELGTRCEALSEKLGADVSRVAEPSAPGPGRARDASEPAALLAMSLAGEGMSREQIGDYLRDSFGIQDADELLERVLPRG